MTFARIARSIAILSAAILASTALPALADGLPTQKVLTVELAETIAHEALMKCRADGYKIVVQVFDAGNALKAFLREDGSALGSIEVSRMKAFTVISFGRPSGQGPTVPPGAPKVTPFLPGTLYSDGALPIKVDGQMIGAVGISGAPGGDKDMACAQAGLDKVAAQLK